MSVSVTYPTAREVLEAHKELSNRQVADLWLSKLEVNETARAMLLPPITEHFRSIRRGMTREVETRVFRKDGKPVDLNDWQRTLDSIIDISIGKRIKIGDATREDWEERIQFLEARRNGIENSIDRAQTAIRLLEVFGVKTLREIPEERLPSANGA